MGGESITLPSGHEPDCSLSSRVVEADWGHKYREGIGQALDYGEQTGTAPGLLLLIDDAEDREGIERAEAIIERYGLPIETWELEVD
ncbi:hypothetical protein [Arhodomonas sp. AD133]|uniref:hypothetical protein n=1 Tax=Arhodomonas sp. AD133 TaxID=3415009 RepID=UPI003EB6F651